MRKPRCNKDKVRNTFLGIIRQKKPKYSRIREAKHILLAELSCGLKSIDRLIASGASLVGLSRHLYHKLLVSGEDYRQQQEMYDKKVNRVDDRIVNFVQPHVRPIVRGKAAAKTEFGALDDRLPLAVDICLRRQWLCLLGSAGMGCIQRIF